MQSPFSNRNFTYLYIGQAVSQFGDWFRTIALLGIMYALVPGASSIGGMFIVSVLPVMFGGILLGPFVDRWNKKKVMIVSDLLRALCILGIIWGAEIGSIWLIYLFIAICSLIACLFGPARQSMMPELLKEQNLVQASASFALLNNVAMVVAGAAASLLIDRIGATPILLFDAASYLVSAVFILLIRYEPLSKPQGSSAARVPYLQQVREGLAFVKSRPQLVSVFWAQAWRDFVIAYVLILFSVFLLSDIGAGNFGIGLGYAMTAVAYVIGALFIKRYFKTHKFDDSAFFKIYFPFTMIYGVGLAIMYSTGSLFGFLAVLLVSYIFLSGVNVITETSLMTYAKPEVRGRVFAGWMSVSRMAYGLSLPLFSTVGNHIPSHIGGYLCGVILVVSALILSIWLKGKLSVQEQTSGG